MTYEEWWKEFTEMNEEWRYADSEALRKAAFESGAASRDAEIAELVAALESVLWWDRNRNYIIPYRVRDPINAAIDKARKP